MELDAAQAASIRLPWLKVTAVGLRLRILTKEEASHVWAVFKLLFLFKSQLLEDIVEDFVLCKATSLSYSCFQLWERDLAVTEVCEQLLIDVWQQCSELLIVVAHSELVAHVD